ncbi:hypothetical protein BDD12DRAFT_800629 [Trichophaea hybrida]|nr:hypothetical protein BDD12DRAFT_800629 [Trichophaea hybrida]
MQWVSLISNPSTIPAIKNQSAPASSKPIYHTSHPNFANGVPTNPNSIYGAIVTAFDNSTPPMGAYFFWITTSTATVQGQKPQAGSLRGPTGEYLRNPRGTSPKSGPAWPTKSSWAPNSTNGASAVASGNSTPRIGAHDF